MPYNIPNTALYGVRFEPETNRNVPIELKDARWTNPSLAKKAITKWQETLGKLQPYQRTRLRQADTK